VGNVSQFKCLALGAIVGGFILLHVTVTGEPYSNVASVLDLTMGARPLALGGAFVGLADDENALIFNPAALAAVRGLSFFSSGGLQPGFDLRGEIGAVLPHLGLCLQYFDFGDIPQVDEFGNIIGSFSYRTYAIIAGAGISGTDIGLKGALFGALGLGVKAKYLRVNTLEPGSGSGLALDVSLRYGGPNTKLRMGFITSFGLGLTIENVVGIPITYGNGHSESWPRNVTFGASATLFDSWLFTMDVVAGKGLRLGVEWCPVSALMVRVGLRTEGVVIWSFGLGVRFNIFLLDYAFVAHPLLPSQHYLSFAINLGAFAQDKR
jgi:hypothetical protein